jgi:hypothetical protein
MLPTSLLCIASLLLASGALAAQSYYSILGGEWTRAPIHPNLFAPSELMEQSVKTPPRRILRRHIEWVIVQMEHSCPMRDARDAHTPSADNAAPVEKVSPRHQPGRGGA